MSRDRLVLSNGTLYSASARNYTNLTLARRTDTWRNEHRFYLLASTQQRVWIIRARVSVRPCDKLTPALRLAGRRVDRAVAVKWPTTFHSFRQLSQLSFPCLSAAATALGRAHAFSVGKCVLMLPNMRKSSTRPQVPPRTDRRVKYRVSIERSYLRTPCSGRENECAFATGTRHSPSLPLLDCQHGIVFALSSVPARAHHWHNCVRLKVYLGAHTTLGAIQGEANKSFAPFNY